MLDARGGGRAPLYKITPRDISSCHPTYANRGGVQRKIDARPTAPPHVHPTACRARACATLLDLLEHGTLHLILAAAVAILLRVLQALLGLAQLARERRLQVVDRRVHVLGLRRDRDGLVRALEVHRHLGRVRGAASVLLIVDPELLHLEVQIDILRLVENAREFVEWHRQLGFSVLLHRLGHLNARAVDLQLISSSHGNGSAAEHGRSADGGVRAVRGREQGGDGQHLSG